MELKIVQDFKFGQGKPPKDTRVSTWFPVYQKIIKSKKGRWYYVEIPSEKVRSALDSIKGYCRRNDMKISLRADKRKISDGVAIIWFSRKF